jgi:hypothetical protein
VRLHTQISSDKSSTSLTASKFRLLFQRLTDLQQDTRFEAGLIFRIRSRTRF